MILAQASENGCDFITVEVLRLRFFVLSPRVRATWVLAAHILFWDWNLVWSPYCDKISVDKADLTRSVQMVQRNGMAWLDILDECHDDKTFHLCGYGDTRCDTGEFSSTWKHHLTKMQVFWTDSHHIVLWNLQWWCRFHHSRECRVHFSFDGSSGYRSIYGSIFW